MRIGADCCRCRCQRRLPIHNVLTTGMLSFCIQALLEKVDTLLQVQDAAEAPAPLQAFAPASAAPPPAGVPPQPAASEAEAPATASSSPAVEQQEQLREQEQQSKVEVSLQEGEDGQIRFQLSPSKLVPAAAAEDAGHVPSSPLLQQPQPLQQSSAASTPFASAATPEAAAAVGRRWQPEPSRPGALVEGAARGACLRASICGCAATMPCCLYARVLTGALCNCRRLPGPQLQRFLQTTSF